MTAISQVSGASSTSHSYCHQLEVFYYALKDADDIPELPREIDQLIDCKGALTKLKGTIHKPGHTMDTDMDLVMAYK